VKFQAKKAMPLVEFLVLKIGCSATKVKKKMKHQDILINGEKIEEHNPVVPEGATVEMLVSKTQNAEGLNILHEDRDIIVVEKKAGLLSVQSRMDKDRTVFGLVNKYLIRKSHNKERALVIHRLDQKVSGVLIFAKTKKAEVFLTKNWSDFNKTYHAAVEGCPDPKDGTVESWLYEDKNYKVHAGPEREGAKFAITHYKLEKKFKNYSLLNVTLGTGKKNQIRVQLAEIECPIVGDMKYGATGNPIGRIGLHAHSLEITHPTSGERMTFHSPSPKSFYKLG
jgi:23S rRNA pseudouridine1911/1915/1917 synthase